VRLVVLLVIPSPGKGDLFVLTVIVEMVVDELTSTITVDAK
jgi:hypothetical protein